MAEESPRLAKRLGIRWRPPPLRTLELVIADLDKRRAARFKTAGAFGGASAASLDGTQSTDRNQVENRDALSPMKSIADMVKNVSISGHLKSELAAAVPSPRTDLDTGILGPSPSPRSLFFAAANRRDLEKVLANREEAKKVTSGWRLTDSARETNKKVGEMTSRVWKRIIPEDRLRTIERAAMLHDGSAPAAPDDDRYTLTQKIEAVRQLASQLVHWRVETSIDPRFDFRTRTPQPPAGKAPHPSRAAARLRTGNQIRLWKLGQSTKSKEQAPIDDLGAARYLRAGERTSMTPRETTVSEEMLRMRNAQAQRRHQHSAHIDKVRARKQKMDEKDFQRLMKAEDAQLERLQRIEQLKILLHRQPADPSRPRTAR